MKILPTAKALTWARKWWFNSILPDWDAHSNLYKKESANSYFTRTVPLAQTANSIQKENKKMRHENLTYKRKETS